MKITDPPTPKGAVLKGRWGKALVQWLIENRVVAGTNILINDASGGGKQINAAPGGVGAVSAFPFSFKIFVRIINGQQKRGVYYRSNLFKGAIGLDEPPERVIITGLLGSDTPPDNDPGWAATEAGDQIWLEVTINSSLQATAATIRSSRVDGTFPGEVINDGGDPPAQIRANLIIGTVETIGTALAPVNRIYGDRRMGVSAFDSVAGGGAASTITAAWPFSY